MFRHTILPILTGLLFVYSAVWMLQMFSYISLFSICAYLILAAALFRRRRDYLLTGFDCGPLAPFQPFLHVRVCR